MRLIVLLKTSPFVEDTTYENLVRSDVMFFILSSDSATKNQYPARVKLRKLERKRIDHVHIWHTWIREVGEVVLHG
jgi:hypothetical protein